MDAESGKSIPYAGAGFKIYDPQGNQVKMTFTYPTPTTIDVFYTDANGSLVTPEKLDYGKGYSIVEVQAPYGYVLDDTPVYFDITEENSTEEGGVKQTNVDTNNRLICYDILDLGKQLMPIGMLVVLDSILNRITQNRAKGKNTFIFIDEIYLLFQHEYSANFLFTLWKRVRKYGAYASGITQNVDDLLQSHTARTMLANSEFIIMLNQASTDRLELAKLLNISDLQMSYITNVEAGHGLIKVGSSLVPFANKFPKNTKLYKLMTTKPGEA